MAPDRLAAAAQAVLDDNWLGSATKPAPGLYPHQWSWDSAFIAIGNRHHRWERAVGELEHLFAAQWAGGMVPHIVFAPDTGDYFPGPSYWDAGRPTSGICQPPVHATAVRKVYEARRDEIAGRRFLEQMCPRLGSWHDYLHRERTVDGPLVEVWHPWESGRDNSPEWDAPMERVREAMGDVPAYERFDTSFVDPGDRPRDTDYHVYAHLVDVLRAGAYSPAQPERLPFRVCDVLFNSVLARAELDLAVLLSELGEDDTSRRERAADLAEAIDARLWSSGTGLYHSFDAVGGTRLDTRTSGGFGPLLIDGIAPARVGRLIETLHRDFLVDVGPAAAVPLTVPTAEAGHEPTRYWRGPAWVNLTWLVAEGLERSGRPEDARLLRNGIAALCEGIGFREYFEPRRRTGHGAERFSWSAALAIDARGASGPPQVA